MFLAVLVRFLSELRMADLSLYLHRAEKAGELCGVSFRGVINAIYEASTLMT